MTEMLKGKNIVMESSSFKQQAQALLEDVRTTLAFMRESGCGGFACNPDSRGLVQQWSQPAAAPGETLMDIENDLGDCRRCQTCHQKRRENADKCG